MATLLLSVFVQLFAILILASYNLWPGAQALAVGNLAGQIPDGVVLPPPTGGKAPPGPDTEAKERARKEAEEKARQEQIERARKKAEDKARAEAEERARKEAEEKARLEAEKRARKEAEEKARVAEEKARLAEEKARLAESKARLAEEKAREEAELRARKEAEEKERQEAKEQETADRIKSLRKAALKKSEQSREDAKKRRGGEEKGPAEQKLRPLSPEDFSAPAPAPETQLNPSRWISSTSVTKIPPQERLGEEKWAEFNNVKNFGVPSPDLSGAAAAATGLAAPADLVKSAVETSAEKKNETRLNKNEIGFPLVGVKGAFEGVPDSLGEGTAIDPPSEETETEDVVTTSYAPVTILPNPPLPSEENELLVSELERDCQVGDWTLWQNCQPGAAQEIRSWHEERYRPVLNPHYLGGLSCMPIKQRRPCPAGGWPSGSAQTAYEYKQGDAAER